MPRLQNRSFLRRYAALVSVTVGTLLPLAAGAQATRAPGAPPSTAALSNSAGSSPRPAAVPPDSSTKRKAGFLAGSGLILLSLLALGTGLALVRAFKR